LACIRLTGAVLLDFEVHYDAADADDFHIHKMFRPVPAVSVLPEWFKRLKTDDHQDQNFSTVKQCKGVWDILSMGYVFLWPFDVEIFKHENGKLDIVKSRTKSHDDFEPHPHIQLEGYQDINFQNQERGVQKVLTPYKIKTPEGTSIMVIQPPYRPDLKTTAMPGIIDSDTFYGDFNILFTINDISGKRKIKIRAGTPLAQIIPFKRDEWKLTFNKVDEDKRQVVDIMSNNIEKFYQRHMWHRKVFTDETDI
jgi:hypothetical protein